jgi:ABC-type antimicrobial peptide transport system permease subunit
LRLSLAGIAVGAVAAFALTRLIAGMLYGVTATDPATYAIIAAIFGVAGVCASCVPAWRAARVDPLEALRRT